MNFIGRTLTAIGLMLGMTLATVQAQTGTGGTISVTVTDPSGASIPGTNLELRSVETNDTHKATTGASGTFAFQSLPFGTYRLEVTKTGFTTRVFQDVEVQTARITDLAVSLTLGTTNDTVTVSSETPGDRRDGELRFPTRLIRSRW